MTVVLVDGDIYAYKAASSVEVETHWGDNFWTLHADADEAIRKFDDTIDEIGDELGADRIIICLSDSSNFRKQVMPEYKANRAGSRKPVCYGGLLDYIKDEYETFQRPTLEADDVLGILSTNTKVIKGERIVVSEDKDLQCIPGLLYNTNDKASNVVKISEHDADYHFFYQTLIGDTTDGYKGCPGIGPVKAREILNEAEDYWEAIIEAFEKAGESEDEALRQARVARILRSEDYNYKTKEPILWTPFLQD